MALVYVDDLTEGMVLAADLLTPTGRFVLAAGACLQAAHLPLLKGWGIIEADIAADSLDESYTEQQEASVEFQERAEAYLWRRFVLNDLDQEPIATLYRHVTHRAALSLQSGWDPISFRSDSLVIDPEQVPPPLSIPQLLRGNIELVSLPTVYAHIIELLKQPDASSYRIANAIDKDPSLTVRLLRLVNSPFYGFAGKIDSVSRAVSLLGTNELTNLTLGITVVKQFGQVPSDVLNMDSFWRHSIRCGLFASYFAEVLGEKEPQAYFTGGLLHDIGRLVMLERMPRQYAAAVAKARQEHMPMCRAEQEYLKMDHNLIGKFLAEKWRLSSALTRMIGGHHSPRLAHYSREACLVHLADIFAHASGHQALLVNEIPELQQRAWTETGLTPEMIAPALVKVDQEFKQIVRVFFAGPDGAEG